MPDEYYQKVARGLYTGWGSVWEQEEQIAEEGKNHSLDLGLIRDDSVLD